MANSVSAFEPSGSYWENGQAEFHIDISGISPSGESWNVAFKRALNTWTQATSFEFIAIDEYLDPCVSRDGLADFGEGTSGVGFSTSLCGTEFGSNVLAVTFLAGNCLNPECTGGSLFTDTDIVFNDNEDWDIYAGDSRNDGVIDFERVALHELGHALGLDHEEVDTPAIMQAFIGDNNDLQIDDINGANSIYGGDATLATVYGLNIIQPENSLLTNTTDNLVLKGTLNSKDGSIDGRYLDVYQFTFIHDSQVDINISSEAIDPLLYFVRVNATQDVINEQSYSDDNSGPGANAALSLALQAGTYWLGVSSAEPSAQGAYGIALSASVSSEEPSFISFESKYGVAVQINPNPRIVGSLSNTDFIFEDRFLDLVQFEVKNTTEVRVELSSNTFNTKLYLFSVLPNQDPGSFIQIDDNSGSSSNSRIESVLSVGTYWLGITSSAKAETGDYEINTTVLLP